jgi:hypothetical protein
MERHTTWLIGIVLGITATGLFTFSSFAQTAEKSTTGSTDLSQQHCQDTPSGELKQLTFGHSLNIVINDREGWASIEAVTVSDHKSRLCLHTAPT